MTTTTVEPSPETQRLLHTLFLVEKCLARPRVRPEIRKHLDRAHADLRADGTRGVLRWIERGTKAKPVRVRAFDLAVANCVAWIAEQTSSSDGERGGSSSPVEVEDRAEARAAHRQALIDVDVFAGYAVDAEVQARILVRTSDPLVAVEAAVALDSDCRRLAQVVARYVVPIDHAKLPPTDPACSSCARVGEHSDVYDKSLKSGLCRWCWDHRGEDGELPPVVVVRELHEKGPRAAGVLMARMVRVA